MTTRGNILCIDYGLKRWGLSFANKGLSFALPLEPYFFKQSKEAIVFIGTLITKYDISFIVIGNPLKLNGQPGSLFENIRNLKLLIETELKISVVLWDERLSSSQAERILKNEHKLKRKKRTDKTDSLAAVIILNSFIETLK